MTKRQQFEAKIKNGSDEELFGSLELCQSQIDELLDREDGEHVRNEYPALCLIRRTVTAELISRGLKVTV